MNFWVCAVASIIFGSLHFSHEWISIEELVYCVKYSVLLSAINGKIKIIRVEVVLIKDRFNKRYFPFAYLPIGKTLIIHKIVFSYFCKII